MGRLLISAAHTLENPGAIYQDLREADLTRKLLQMTIPHLEKLNVAFQPVPLDLPLLQRIDWINATGYTEEQGDIFVELHINDGGKRGIETWYSGSPSTDNNSQKLAEALGSFVSKSTGYTNQGAKSEYEHELTSLIVLNQTLPIGTAIEALYLDNEEDIVLLKDDVKLDALAKTIAEGIDDFLKKPISISSPKRDIGEPTSNLLTDSQQMTTPSVQNPFPTFTPSSYQSTGSNNGSRLGTGFTPPPSTGGSKATLMDRDQRKEMIKKVYQKILGKEPNQSDLNYYLNTGTNEDELTKKLLESPDFTTMVKDASEMKGVREANQKLEASVAELEAKLDDTKKLQESLNKLLNYKNSVIHNLNRELVDRKVLKAGEHIESKHTAGLQTESHPLQSVKLQKNFRQRVMDFIIDLTKI